MYYMQKYPQLSWRVVSQSSWCLDKQGLDVFVDLLKQAQVGELKDWTLWNTTTQLITKTAGLFFWLSTFL